MIDPMLRPGDRGVFGFPFAAPVESFSGLVEANPNMAGFSMSFMMAYISFEVSDSGISWGRPTIESTLCPYQFFSAPCHTAISEMLKSTKATNDDVAMVYVPLIEHQDDLLLFASPLVEFVINRTSTQELLVSFMPAFTKGTLPDSGKVFRQSIHYPDGVGTPVEVSSWSSVAHPFDIEELGSLLMCPPEGTPPVYADVSPLFSLFDGSKDVLGIFRELRNTYGVSVNYCGEDGTPPQGPSPEIIRNPHADLPVYTSVAFQEELSELFPDISTYIAGSLAALESAAPERIPDVLAMAQGG